MQAAQIAMWFCFFWLVEGAEDVITDPAKGSFASTGLLPPAMALFAIAMCRAWAGAEFRFATAGQKGLFWRMLLSRQKDQNSLTWSFRMVLHMVVLPLPLLLKTMPGAELIDKVGLLCTTVLCVVAWNRWLVLLSEARVSAKFKSPSVIARASAA